MLSRVKLFLPVLLLAFLAGQPASSQGETPVVRVGLVRHVPSIAFSGSQGATVQLPVQQLVRFPVPAGEVWQAVAAPEGVRILAADGTPVTSHREQVSIFPPPGETVTLQGIPGHWDNRTERDYRGTIIIRADGAGGLTVINVLDVEAYLRGVVPSEMPAKYPRAALQAQAVAARGQALVKASRHEEEGFGPCNGPHCQVYGGATSEDPRSDEAVAGTRGQVLAYQGRIADTLYSSNCGGHTANSEDYWPDSSPVPYLRGVPDCDAGEGDPPAPTIPGEDVGAYLKYAPRVNCNLPQYASSSKIRWWQVVPRDALEAALREKLGDFGHLLGVRVLARADSGMVTRLLVIGTKRTCRIHGGSEARRVLDLDSPSFVVEPVLGGGDVPVAFVIWGAGWVTRSGCARLAPLGWRTRGGTIGTSWRSTTEVRK